MAEPNIPTGSIRADYAPTYGKAITCVACDTVAILNPEDPQWWECKNLRTDECGFVPASFIIISDQLPLPFAAARVTFTTSTARSVALAPLALRSTSPTAVASTSLLGTAPAASVKAKLESTTHAKAALWLETFRLSTETASAAAAVWASASVASGCVATGISVSSSTTGGGAEGGG